MMRFAWILAAGLAIASCDSGADGDTGPEDARSGDAPDVPPSLDGGSNASPATDAPRFDATDSGLGLDALTDVFFVPDAGLDTALALDSGFDSGFDSGLDGGFDSGFDGGFDSGFDGGRDAPVGSGCVSGPTGTHVLRFRWAGSGPGSTAYVMYEANTMPDTACGA